MSIRRLLYAVGQVVVVIAVVSLVLGSVLGQPVLLGYVTSGSMQPTIDPGDGFVAVPTAITGPVTEGDVVVYRPRKTNGGRLTTHRVVEETDRGFVTKGDANPFTDQDDGEPPVKRPQVVAKALQVNGNLVVIPHLGTVIAGTQSVLATAQRHLAALLGTRSLLGFQGLAYLFFGGTLAWYAIGEWRDRGAKRRRRATTRESGTDGRLVVGGFAAVLVVAATAAMVVPAGPQEYGVVSAEFTSERPGVIRAGESRSRTYAVANGGLVPVVAYLEPGSEGVTVSPRELRVGSVSTAEATVTLAAPRETGYYRRYVVEHRYLLVLPPGAIDALYGIHPWLPILAIDALVGVPFYLLGIRLAGTGRVRDRTRSTSTSLRLRRWIRRRY